MNRKPNPPKSVAEYTERELVILRDHAPETYPCAKCKWPVVKGYTCQTCGDERPYENQVKVNFKTNENNKSGNL